MYSRLDSVFRQTFRTEPVDPYRGIVRHEPEDNTKRRAPRDAEREEDGFALDHAEISLPALVGFLTMLLQENGVAVKTAAGQGGTSAAEIPPNAPANATAARAMQAYTHTAGITEPAPQIIPAPAPAPAPTTDTPLSALEIDAMQTLLEDLALLNKAGVQMIEITRSGSFLQSLIDGAAAAKARL